MNIRVSGKGCMAVEVASIVAWCKIFKVYIRLDYTNFLVSVVKKCYSLQSSSRSFFDSVHNK